MNKNNKKMIALIGATGNVGRKIIEIILQRKACDPNCLQLFASKHSAGKKLTIDSYTFTIHAIDDYDFKDCYLALFATDSDVSKQYIPKALAEGAKVIDSSSAYRLDESVPLIVPPVNLDLINGQQLIAVANCLAAPIAVALKPLHCYATITRLVVTTYQSTSGAGKRALDELDNQIKNVMQNKRCEPKVFKRQIAFNVIPQVDDFLHDGYSYEEHKIANEIKKIISPAIKIAATACRVPVRIGHSIALAIEFKNKINVTDIRKIMQETPGLALSSKHYTTPIEVEGSDQVFVGRIRVDKSVDHGLLLWLASDNLRRGAALDVVELVEKLRA